MFYELKAIYLLVFPVGHRLHENKQIIIKQTLKTKQKMKTFKLIPIAAIAAIMLASCGSSKQTSTASSSSYGSPKSNPLGEEVNLPCVYESMDDDSYFRELGTANSINMQSARTAAFNAAKSMIKQKLGEFVQGVSSSYSRTVAGQAPADKVQRLMEDEMNGIVERMLNDAQKICEKMYQGDDGNYKAFIAIQIPKKAMIDNMANTLSSNEELEIEFNRDQFRKYAEDKLAKMKAAKKETGY